MQCVKAIGKDSLHVEYRVYSVFLKPIGICAILPSLTVGKIKMATNPVNMGSVAVFYFVTICAIL